MKLTLCGRCRGVSHAGHLRTPHCPALCGEMFIFLRFELATKLGHTRFLLPWATRRLRIAFVTGRGRLQCLVSNMQLGRCPRIRCLIARIRCLIETFSKICLASTMHLHGECVEQVVLGSSNENAHKIKKNKPAEVS